MVTKRVRSWFRKVFARVVGVLDLAIFAWIMVARSRRSRRRWEEVRLKREHLSGLIGPPLARPEARARPQPPAAR